MLAGTRCSRVQEIFEPFTLMDICDYLPVLRWIGFRGIEKKMVKLQKIRDTFMQDLIDKCRQNKASSKPDGNDTKSIIGSLLGLQEAEPELYTDEIIKGIILVSMVKCVWLLKFSFGF